MTDVLYSIGRTGKISVILGVEPTMIDGRKVSRIYIGSAVELIKQDIAIGDTITFTLSGQSIPRFKSVILRRMGASCLIFLMRHCFLQLAALHIVSYVFNNFYRV
ncbi:hypothetical protein [Orbus mooreae]|uniref:hypothetical protein n=1 Tax=Orbus mooreae TaxID=3074107 RepID=UPI00370D5395